MSEDSARRKATLWVGAVFVLGVTLGGVVGYVFARQSVAAARAPMNEGQRRAHRVEELGRELGLSDSQKQQLDGVLTQIHSEILAARKQCVEPVWDKGRDQMRSILTPEQKTKFDEYVKRKDEERKRHNPGNPR
jgi:Spy/CpxP family protein refolding chaperone